MRTLLRVLWWVFLLTALGAVLFGIALMSGLIDVPEIFFRDGELAEFYWSERHALNRALGATVITIIVSGLAWLGIECL